MGRRPTHVASWRVEFEQNIFIQIYPALNVLYDITRYFVSTPSCIIVGVAPVITYVFFFRQRSEAVKAGAHYKPVAPGCALKTSTMWAVLSALWKTTGSRFAVAKPPKGVSTRLRASLRASNLQALKASCAFAQDERLRRMLQFKR